MRSSFAVSRSNGASSVVLAVSSINAFSCSGAPAARVHAALRRRGDVRLVLDRARPQQRFPMRGAGRHGEGGRHEHGVERSERAIQLGVAHIVADREREAPEWARHGHRALARLERARLVVALFVCAEAKEVHLVVARDALAGIVVDEARAADAPGIGARDGHRAADEPDGMRARTAGKKILDGSRALGLAQAHLVGFVAADEVEVLRQRDEPSACRDGSADQAAGGLEVRCDFGPRDHLHRGDTHRAHCVAVSVGVGATLTFVTLGSVQLPLTSNSCAKSWPSGFLSTCCASAAATPTTGLTIAMAVDAEPPRLGTTRTLRFSVSCARSTCPDIATSAAGPRMRNCRRSMRPWSTRDAASMRSKRNPLENTSRKSSVMRRGSACRFMSEISLPSPGSISRHWAFSALLLSSPPSTMPG